MDFNEAWKKARSGQQSGLFASEYAYGYPNIHRHRQSQLTQQQKAYRAATYQTSLNPTVWPEYQNTTNHRYQYSPTLAKTQHNAAMAVFARAEQVLTAAKKRW
jgi:hypothetical protein